MYERIHPAINGTEQQTGNHYVAPAAPVQVVQVAEVELHLIWGQGTAGVFLDHKFVEPQPSWSAQRLANWGYGRLTVNQTHLQYDFMDLQSRKAIDSFTIQK